MSSRLGREASVSKIASNSFPGKEDDQYVQWFRQSWPYIRGHRGSTVVVVISGEVIASSHLDNILQVAFDGSSLEVILIR